MGTRVAAAEAILEEALEPGIRVASPQGVVVRRSREAADAVSREVGAEEESERHDADGHALSKQAPRQLLGPGPR